MAKQRMFQGARHIIFQNAERLRHNMTAAEMLLWGHLRGNQLGSKFRRQHPISCYIADFYCHKHKLVIEIDGSIHLLPEVVANDIERQNNLESSGVRVLRFTNDQIFKNIKQC